MQNLSIIMVVILTLICSWSATGTKIPLISVMSASESLFPNLVNYAKEWNKKVSSYKDLKMDTSSELEKFYRLIDLVSLDAHLEIENVCLRNFDIDYCGEVSSKIARHWATYGTALRQDSEFVELNIHMMLGSMEDSRLYDLLVGKRIIEEIFERAASMKAIFFEGFKKN